MIKNKLILTIGILLVVGVLAGYKIINQMQTLKQIQNEPEVHYHAGFVVFDNGKRVDFSAIKYMNITPCAEHSIKEKETPEHTQTEKAHLHDMVGDVVHSHRAGAVWNDLFTNIKYQLDYSNTVAYVNGQRIEGVENYPIKAYDRVVFFVGSVDEKLLDKAPTEEFIKEVEKKSENCGE